jgi:tripartite-type tricarboxylate transporter receptor subunit TctC
VSGHAVRLIATDMDGTLLRSDQTISARTLAAIRDAHEAGIVVMAATGRGWRSALPLLAVAPLVLAVPASMTASGAEFFHAAREAGDRWNYGTPGVGTVAHLGMELLKGHAGMGAVHVPYPGNPQVIAAMLSDQLQMALLPPGLAMAQVRAGKLRAIGVTSRGRSSVVPELPSLAELGVRDMQMEIWNAMAAPNSLPKAHVNRLAVVLTEIVRRPEIRQNILNQGWQVAGTAPEGLAQRVQADTAAMAEVIRRNNIRPN